MRILICTASLVLACGVARAGVAEDAAKRMEDAADLAQQAVRTCTEKTMSSEIAPCLNGLIPGLERMKKALDMAAEKARPAQTAAAAAAASPAAGKPVDKPVDKKLTAADMGVETSKWNGKYVEATLQCFYADKNEYRCTAGTGRIDFSELTPNEQQEKLEKDCDTIANMSKMICRRTVRFVYKGSEMVNVGGLMGRMNLVRAVENRGEIVASPGRR